MTPAAVLNKIKYLLALTRSPNTNEAAAAQSLANSMIEKHGVSEAELESLKDTKPLYGDEEKLFITLGGIVGWKQQLSLGVAAYFDCLIVQERQVPAEGMEQYHYYVYGGDLEVEKVKLAFGAFQDKVQEYIDTRCLGKTPSYLNSYGEGIVLSIRDNIYLHGIVLPNKKKLTPQSQLDAKEGDITPTKKEKVRPAEQSVDVNSQSLVEDIAGYFAGVYDGQSLSLVDILELVMQNEEPEQLT